MGAGHASTSISYATGLAEAQRQSGRDDARVLCVIGDGALTGGMAYEGLNQAGALGSPITVVLNDNGMSISENVGALSKLFQRARVDPTLKRMREEVEKGLSRLPGGSELGGHIRDATKSLWFVPGALFEALGFAYLGPIDGHDIERGAPGRAQHARHGPPGRGPREDGQGPRLRAGGGRRRGHARRDPLRHRERQGRRKKSPGPPNYTDVFGHALVAEAERDPRVVGITAAMLKGTGMQHMMARFPERTYDVGIAEQHAVVFACGLAIAGYRPVCAIYSTFLQRAFDPIVHDAAIQNLPVVFAIDRGGLVGDDGPTHHGVFDLAYLRAIPGLTIMAPDGRGRARGHAPHGAAARRPGGVPLPARRGPGRRDAAAARDGRDRPGAGAGGRRDASPWWATATAPSRARGRRGWSPRPSAPARPWSTRASASRSTRTLMRQLAERHELVVTIEDHAQLAGFGSAVLECPGGRPGAGAAARDPRPLRRPRQARASCSTTSGLSPAQVAARIIEALRSPAAPARRGELSGGLRKPGYHPPMWPGLDSMWLWWSGDSSRRAPAPRPRSWRGASTSTDGRRTSRASPVAEDAELAVAPGADYVSRGGIKLANALEALGVDVTRAPRRSTWAPPRGASPTACCGAAPSGSSPSTWATGSSTGGCARIHGCTSWSAPTRATCARTTCRTRPTWSRVTSPSSRSARSGAP